MASSIYFNGRRIVVPQVPTKIDASALDAVGPSAVGVVALVGTAEGGEPLTVDVGNDVVNPQQLRTQYRDGDLRTGGLFAFNPSQDEAIQGGAQRIVPVKVNPSTQSTAQLADASANPSVDLTSVDWGQATEQINIDVAPGTVQGKQIVITLEDFVETFDDVGGDAAMTVLYTPGTDGYDTVTGAVTASDFTAAAAKAEAGLTAEMTAVAPAGLPSAVSVVSSAGADTTQEATIYGIVGGVATREVVSLNGTTPVLTTATAWTKVLGVVLSAAAAGTVTVADGSANTIATLAPATLARGVVLLTNAPGAGPATVSIDADTAVDVALFGTNASGAQVGEVFDMTAGNTTPVVGSVDFTGELQVLALGEVAGARTITVDIDSVIASTSTFQTVQQLVDRLNALAGYTATADATNATVLRVDELDYSAAISLVGAAADFFADLYAFVSIINAASGLVTAARATGASEVPAATVSPVYLTGGTEGTPTITEWQAAFDLLRKRRVNIIVPLTRDPAVHALLLEHLIYRAGAGASEANGYVGIGTAGGAGETLANYRAQVQTLNTRHISAISEEVKRFSPVTGEATWYPPHFLGAIAAGMQAGSPIGEPLTRKIINALDVRNDSSWARDTDAEVLLDSGAMITEKVDGIGIRWVRSLTTFLQSDNLVFTEMSANESANAAVFELRRQLDQKIGDRGLASSVGIIKGLATDILERLVTDEIIAGWKPATLTVTQIGDVFPVSVEIAPVVPINFIPVTIHLVPLSAAA